MNTLRLKGIEAGYGDVQVLWGIDLEVRKGEVVCVIGSNGAGKTTLVKVISGLIPVKHGTVSYGDRDLTGASPRDVLESGIAHVPEGRRLFYSMSVEDNLLMGAYLRSDRKAIYAALDRVYGFFPRLFQRRAQMAGTLSGGEQQMCALGRGLMSAPNVLMIDELSLGLAPQIVDQLSAVLLQVREEGVSIIVVEQDIGAALELSDYGVVIDRGKVTLSDRSDTLQKNPMVKEAYMGLVQ